MGRVKPATILHSRTLELQGTVQKYKQRDMILYDIDICPSTVRIVKSGGKEGMLSPQRSEDMKT